MVRWRSHILSQVKHAPQAMDMCPKSLQFTVNKAVSHKAPFPASQPTFPWDETNTRTNLFQEGVYLSPVRVDVGPIHRVSFFFLWRLIPSSVVATHLSSAQPENAGESLVGVVSVAGRMVRRGRTCIKIHKFWRNFAINYIAIKFDCIMNLSGCNIQFEIIF